MITPSIADLDELVLLCRDERARSYITEAVNCYRSGAFRAAIVATWVAVCFDIIDKLRELNLSGDKGAEKIVDGIDKARSTNDFASSLKFERELLNIARDQFEFISHLEHIDLDRLQQDRNRCAHPSLQSDDQAFLASAELARLHIRSAVTHLLQHPPAQGKYALERLIHEVNSEYFPDDITKATSSLSSGPLKRPRETLVRNFIVVLLKQALAADTKWKSRLRTYVALSAVKTLHSSIFERTIQEKLSHLFRAIEDKNLCNAILLLKKINDCWFQLDASIQHKIESYVADLPANNLENLDFLLTFLPLKSHAQIRLGNTTEKELRETPFCSLPNEVADKLIAIYLSSSNYAQANLCAQQIINNASDFSAEQQLKIIEGISKNSQVSCSVEVGSVIYKLRQTNKIQSHEFDSALSTNELAKYVTVTQSELSQF